MNNPTRKICIVTGTRAEYGLLSRLMRLIADSPLCQLQVIATNMHLSEQFGLTYKEIEADGFKIDAKVPMERRSDSPADTVDAMAQEMAGIKA